LYPIYFLFLQKGQWYSLALIADDETPWKGARIVLSLQHVAKFAGKQTAQN
jgi:hypothetical protein